MEIVDVVDENDNIVDQKPKDFCHANGLVHRGGSVYIFKDKTRKELLLQQRSLNKSASPGKWCEIGGHINAGESYIDGARRELGEEMFHNAKMPNIELTPLFKTYKDRNGDCEFITIFEGFYDKNDFSYDPKEVMNHKFVPINELIENVNSDVDEYTATFKFMFKHYMKLNNIG